MTLPLSLTVVAAEQSLVELEAKAATLSSGSRFGIGLGRTIVGGKCAVATSKVLEQEAVQLLDDFRTSFNRGFYSVDPDRLGVVLANTKDENA